MADPKIRALLFGVQIRAPDSWKLPYRVGRRIRIQTIRARPRAEIWRSLRIQEGCLSKGSKYSYMIYFGLKVLFVQVLWGLSI